MESPTRQEELPTRQNVLALVKELQNEYMDSDTIIKLNAINAEKPEFLNELYAIQNNPKSKGMLYDKETLRQLINVEYFFTVKGYTLDQARLYAQNIERNLASSQFNDEELVIELTKTLGKAFTDGVLVKDCHGDGGSNTLFRKTKETCCKSICVKINKLVNELEEILAQHGIDMGSKTIADIAPLLRGRFTVGDKKSNIFKYFENCKEDGNIDDKTYVETKLNIEKLAFFLGISSQQEQTGGYSKNKYRRTSKKSRKSHRHRRHRRSSYNKKHHVKRHTKRHTKRYRNRK